MYANRYQQLVCAQLDPALLADKPALAAQAIEGIRHRLMRLLEYVDACLVRGEAPRRGRLAYEAGDVLQHLAELSESQDLAFGTLLYWNLRDIENRPTRRYVPRSRLATFAPLANTRVHDGHSRPLSFAGTDVRSWLASVAGHGEASVPDEAEMTVMILLLQALADPDWAVSGEILRLIQERRTALEALGPNERRAPQGGAGTVAHVPGVPSVN